MFNLEDIAAAHSKVKSGVDFPTYIQDLIKLGVKKYDTFVRDGHTVFEGTDKFRIKSAPKYTVLRVANISDKERFKHHLKRHQRGQTDYETFCTHSAETGVKKWTVDMNEMTCTYYDKEKNKMLQEQIPTP
ncbi:MAG: DUF1398 family protein [Ferruginibacter sp.]|nr:DUF1398 family protein [Ferruginibacter sp.]